MSTYRLKVRYSRVEGGVVKKYKPGSEVELSDREVAKLGPAAFDWGPNVVMPDTPAEAPSEVTQIAEPPAPLPSIAAVLSPPVPVDDFDHDDSEAQDDEPLGPPVITDDVKEHVKKSATFKNTKGGK